MRRASVLLALLVGVLAGCGDDGLVRPGGAAALVVVTTDSPLPIERLRLVTIDGKRRVEFAFKSRADAFQVRVFRVPAGRYKLDRVILPSTRRGDWDFVDSDEYEFTGERANFLGELSFWFEDGSLRYRLRDRSARALVGLRELGDAEVNALPLRFVGGKGDEWISSLKAEPR